MTTRTHSVNGSMNITEVPRSLLWSIMAALNQLRTLTDELHDDHATVKTELEAIGATLADYKTQFDAHTHTQQDGDGAQTSIPDDTAGGVATAGTDRVFSDSSGSPPGSLESAKVDDFETREVGTPS